MKSKKLCLDFLAKSSTSLAINTPSRRLKIGAHDYRSFNIRGGGSKIKRKRVSQILIKGKADIFLIQESKLVNMDSNIINSLWSNEKVGWSFSSSNVASGGLITMSREEFCRLCPASREKVS